MKRMQVWAAVAVLSIGLGTGCSKKAAPVQNANPNATGGTNGMVNSDGSPVGAAGGTLGATGAAPSPAPVGPNGARIAAEPNYPPAGQNGANSGGPAPIERVAPVVRTAPAGTAVTIRTTEEVSSKGDVDGQHFSGVLERPVVSHGTVVFERGTPVAGEVVSEKNKGTFKGAGEIGVVLTAIDRVPVHTSEYVLRNKGRGKRTGAFIGGGGGLGAIIGGIAGGGKGALIGGLAGAGAGTAASTTGSKDVVIRPESVITFRLREAVSR